MATEEIGIFTPDGQALCRACAKPRADWPEGKDTSERLGHCTACGREIYLRADVALFTNIMHAHTSDGSPIIRYATLEQTGGMCAALSVTRADCYVFVVRDDNGEMFATLYASELKMMEDEPIASVTVCIRPCVVCGGINRGHTCCPDGSDVPTDAAVRAIAFLLTLPMGTR